MAKKTHEEFMKELEEKQPNLFYNLEFLEEYVNTSINILVKDKFGLCKSNPAHLLEGKTPSIKSALDKNSYFLNKLKDLQPELHSKITLKSNYVKSNADLLVEIEGVLYSSCGMDLFVGSTPTISAAVDKNKCFEHKAKKVHGDKYQYDKINYINNSIEIEIYCNKCKKYFPQLPAVHLIGSGCTTCSRERINTANKLNPVGWDKSSWKNLQITSKKVKEYKVYIIECWNNEERFYKIGRTSNTTKYRFRKKEQMPYNYKILKEIIADSDFIYDLENRLKKENKQYKYLPKLEFAGMHECFSNVNLNIHRELLPIN